MTQLLRRAPQPIKKILRTIARRTIGRLPAPASRLTGALAHDGGRPVRDLRLRPWASVEDGNLARWHTEMRAVFRRIFLGGVEGLPQPLAEEFARQWAAYCGCRYGLLLGNGTDALRIGLAAVLDHDGLDYGGEVIVPNFSFIASATAPLDRRFGVAFVDVDQGTLLLDPKRVEEAIVPGKTRAIMPVHLFGQPADMTALKAIADKHGLKIIEDAAQAHGAVWETGPVGSLGDAGAFSFQSSKNLASGEGGALTTNDEQVFERAYSMHNAGRSRIGGGRWAHVTSWLELSSDRVPGRSAHSSLSANFEQHAVDPAPKLSVSARTDGRCRLPGAFGFVCRCPRSRNVYVRDALQAGILRQASDRQFPRADSGGRSSGLSLLQRNHVGPAGDAESDEETP